MSYDLRPHTADVAVAARGESLEATFASVADGLAGASTGETSITDVPASEADDDRFSVRVEAEGLEALLFDYLDELIYLRDVRGELPVEHEVRRVGQLPEPSFEASDGEEPATTGTRWVVDASARGRPLSRIDAREIKAVTYSEMRLEETDAGWEAYVVFDV